MSAYPNGFEFTVHVRSVILWPDEPDTLQRGEVLEFSVAEMRRRRTAFGRELERNDTTYALVYGANRSGSAVSWLTGWPVTREALLVVAPEPDDDVLLVSFFNHVPQARRLSAARVDLVLAAGMTMVVQPNVVTRDGRAGVQTGELLLVTDRGPQRLHAYPPGLAQVG